MQKWKFWEKLIELLPSFVCFFPLLFLCWPKLGRGRGYSHTHTLPVPRCCGGSNLRPLSSSRGSFFTTWLDPFGASSHFWVLLLASKQLSFFHMFDFCSIFSDTYWSLRALCCFLNLWNCLTLMLLLMRSLPSRLESWASLMLVLSICCWTFKALSVLSYVPEFGRIY